jgi:hypothetical protein
MSKQPPFRGEFLRDTPGGDKDAPLVAEQYPVFIFQIFNWGVVFTPGRSRDYVWIFIYLALTPRIQHATLECNWRQTKPEMVSHRGIMPGYCSGFAFYHLQHRPAQPSIMGIVALHNPVVLRAGPGAPLPVVRTPTILGAGQLPLKDRDLYHLEHAPFLML